MTAAASKSLAAITRTAHEVWSERADLRERFGDIGSLGFWQWLMSTGAVEVPGVLEALPIPRVELSMRVGEPTVEHYLDSGLSDSSNVFERLMAGGLDLDQNPSVLDFGCGCGRIMRFAARLAGGCQLFGADIDQQSIDWCREHLDFANYERIASRPRSPFQDAQFQAVYSYSVFTHLPEELHRQWLEELHRITAPGGVLVITLMGRRVIQLWVRGETYVSFPPPEVLLEDLPNLEDKGYLYYPYPPGNEAVPEEDKDAGLYGMTFILESYVRENWLDLFELVSFEEAPQGWQDFVVLRRR